MKISKILEVHKPIPFNDQIMVQNKEPVLHKIGAEIMDIRAYEQETMGQTEFLKGINSSSKRSVGRGGSFKIERKKIDGKNRSKIW